MDSAHWVRHLEHVMGTVVTIDIYTDHVVHGDEIALQLGQASAILQHAENVFSTWKENSPISRLRRGEITSEQAPSDVAKVLECCARARELSDGWFDPWAMPGGIDPTGYVKGWAAQCALDALTSSKTLGAMVNAAGDVAGFGGMGNAQPFRIGIVDPWSPRQLACVVELAGALATSGAYERGPHLIDPHSGRPTVRVASASVSGPDLGMADALATARGRRRSGSDFYRAGRGLRIARHPLRRHHTMDGELSVRHPSTSGIKNNRLAWKFPMRLEACGRIRVRFGRS
jgi:thiamine biosynthesis lipoprotein